MTRILISEKKMKKIIKDKTNLKELFDDIFEG